VIENSDLQQKIAVRQKGLCYTAAPYNVLDLYAGSGVITERLWSKIAKKVVCVEKQQGKLKLNLQNVECHTSSNDSFLCRTQDFNVIDCDAYGMVAPVLKKIINLAANGSVVFFTEFNPVRAKHNWQGEFVNSVMSPKIRGLYYEKASNSQTIYGYLII
jgi:tRNA G26 N,N-dimethylase Trm1